AYGFVSPIAALLDQKLSEVVKELQCVKVTLLASMSGYAPAIAIEFGRKVLFSTERPSFVELEAHVKQLRASAK
ncbi:MAG: flagellar motor stator protein MotA, partial [Burkholderiales bacterium]